MELKNCSAACHIYTSHTHKYRHMLAQPAKIFHRLKLIKTNRSIKTSSDIICFYLIPRTIRARFKQKKQQHIHMAEQQPFAPYLSINAITAYGRLRALYKYILFSLIFRYYHAYEYTFIRYAFDSWDRFE